jgi:THO complex subunit 1
MPALDVDDLGVPHVAAFGSLLNELLEEAAALKPPATDRTPSASIEPPINKHDLNSLSDRIASAFSGITVGGTDDEAAVKKARSRKFAAIEAVARDFFSKLTVRTDPELPAGARKFDGS